MNKAERDELLQAMIEFQVEYSFRGRDVNIIGENVKYFREERGYSSKELCERAGISRSTLYKIESGKIIPKLSTLSKIVDALSLIGDSFMDFIESIREKPIESMFDDQDNYNIYKLEEQIMSLFRHNMYYYKDGKRQYFPKMHLEILKSSISAAFSILNLIAHDENQNEEYHKEKG